MHKTKRSMLQQKYVREEAMTEMIREELKKVSLVR